MGNEKLSAEYRRDCARAEEEALQTLRSVHMPVINIPSIRDITLANYRRRMVKCDGKMWENDIVLVATTDFVAASLACPTLFGWNLPDNNDQISALLADLDRRWTRLLTTDVSRRAALLALLESSLRCLDDRYVAFFAAARHAGRPNQSQQAVSNVDQSQRSTVDGFNQPHRSISNDDQLRRSVPIEDQSQRSVPSNAFKPTPPPKTLHAFFKPRVAKPVALSDDPAQDVVWVGDVTPKVFAAPQGKMLVYAPNNGDPAQNQNERGTHPLDLSARETQTVRLANHGSPSLTLSNHHAPPSSLTHPCLLPQNLTNRGQLPQSLTNGSSVLQDLRANRGSPPLFTNHGLLPQTPTNHGLLPQTPTNHGLLPQTPTNQSSLPLVNATNVAKLVGGGAKPPVNALLALMTAAKENQRKRAASVCASADKSGRKGW